MSTFALATLAAYAVTIAFTATRSRAYAMFRGVILAIQSLVAVALFPHVGVLEPVFIYLHASVFVHSALLARPRMFPLPYRLLVSIPGSFFWAGTFLAAPWAVAAAFGLPPVGLWVPYVLAAIGVFQSLSGKGGELDVVVADGTRVDGVRRHAPGEARSARPLSIFQITDPHLGPFMSVARLRRICERAVEQKPDLVLLTGDFLTMESQHDPMLLGRALEPLRALDGRAFACRGNHDHEAPETVRRACEHAGVRLLIDEAEVVETDAGPVQVVGMDYHWKARADRMRVVCERFPRLAAHLRIVLLHDPGAFRHLPEGEADLVLSGHTHGGQIGLVSLGLAWTAMRSLTSMPDHGFWARGTDRLYVHRGTGHYGFPLRLGVPAEQSLLRVHSLAAAPEAGE